MTTASTAAVPLLPTAASDGLVLQVTAKEMVAEGVCRLTLTDPCGRLLPGWAPGAHIDVILPGGYTRQYSLCGDRWDGLTYRVAVLREQAGRGGSAYIHDDVAVGDTLSIGGPRNNFPMVPADEYLFVAGGIGITPILPMLAQAEMLGVPWSLLYGGRTRASMAFTEELARYGERVQLVPQDECGQLDLSAALARVGAAAKVYCCGPPALLSAIENCCADWPCGRLRIERFVPREMPAPMRKDGFELRLQRSGVTVVVGPSTSVLDAIESAGVPVLSSCRQGTCGTCEMTVLDGVPDHRDALLNDDERALCDRMFVCVSRSCSPRLVLDV